PASSTGSAATPESLPVRAAFFGGIYNNWLALDAALADARRRGAERLFCLGDVGGFGNHPDRSIELLQKAKVELVQGNYDDAVGNAREDCGCGYTDPRDNHFARLSYAYTLEKTSAAHRPWLAALQPRLDTQLDAQRLVLVHGSPRQQNEFLWESTAPDAFLERLCAD